MYDEDLKYHNDSIDSSLPNSMRSLGSDHIYD